MNESKQDQHAADLQEEVQTFSEGSEPGLKPGIEALCVTNVSIGRLRKFLFNVKDGQFDTDPELQQHLEKGCWWCDTRRKHLERTSDYLRGWSQPKFLAMEEMPARPGTANTIQDVTAYIDEAPASESERSTAVWRKLAKLGAMPAEPLRLEKLEELYADLQNAEEAAERAALVRYISRICDLRWQRLDTNLRAIAQTVADELMTTLKGGTSRFEQDMELSKASDHDARRLPAEFSEDHALAFLVYMMSRPWFLSSWGPRVWATVPAGANAAQSRNDGAGLVLYFDVLRQALGIPDPRIMPTEPWLRHV